MKAYKLLILILLSLSIAGCFGHCTLEKEKTHMVATPLVEAIATYAKTNGAPKSFEVMKSLPYNLEPCSEKTDLFECEVLRDGYFFEKDNEYYAVRLNQSDWTEGFGMVISHNYTTCDYTFFEEKNKLLQDYATPACSLIGSCASWGRQ